MRRKKILYFLSYADSIEESIQVGHIDRLCKELRALLQNFEVILFSKDCPSIFRKLKDRLTHNIVFRGIPFSIFGNTNFSGIKGYFRKICSAIIFLEYQALSPFLHISDFKKADVYYARHISGALAGIIAKKIINKRIKVIVRLYWSWSGYNLKENSRLYYLITAILEKSILKHCDYFILAPGTPAERIRLPISNRRACVEYLPNWIDTNIFAPDNTIKKDYDLLFLGRLEHVKNPLLFLEALHLANKNISPGLKALCIGNGALRDEITLFCEQKHIDISMINAVPNDKLPDYLRKCKVYCITSMHEGCPKALLEAMSCGLLCIGTQVQGIVEIIRDGNNGFLTHADARSLAGKMLNALTKYDSYYQIRENARTYIENNYSFEKVIVKLERILAMRNDYER